MSKARIVFIESGRRRVGERAKCQHCPTIFVRRKSGSNGVKLFCSRLCSQLASRNRVVVSCSVCLAKMDRPASRLKKSKSGLFFCSTICQSSAQKIDGGLSAIHPPHYGSGDAVYRAVAFRVHPPNCVDCGLCFLPLLTVHHKDGDRKNSDPRNLEIVCFNHHVLRHLRLDKSGKWVFSTSSLTPRRMLNKLRKVIDLGGVV